MKKNNEFVVEKQTVDDKSYNWLNRANIKFVYSMPLTPVFVFIKIYQHITTHVV